MNRYQAFGRKIVHRIFALLTLMMTFSASAVFTSGNDLKSYMDEDDNGGSFLGGVYSGYVIGVHDAFDDVLFCTPENVTKGQVKAVISKYLKANPEQWNKSADSIVIEALRGAFPCKKS
ncbi:MULTISPECIES: Rap1a/Tai family immunity protein [Aeromonas]|uniref:Rap1a/Tai family immunity protein n=1 Tax=Aeromonas TaxID=642 RepID=UPI00366DFEEF